MKKLFVTLLLALAAPLLAQDRLAELNDKIAAFERVHPKKMVNGKISDMIKIEDGSVAYLTCDTDCSIFSHWFIVAHPVRGMIHPPTGSVAGTMSNGIYIGEALFMKTVPDAVFVAGRSFPAAFCETNPPPEIAKLYEERAPLLEAAKAKQESMQRAQEKEVIKTVETRTIKIEIASIEWRGEQGMMLYVMPGNGLPQPSDCHNCNPIIYVTAEVASKIGDQKDWEKLTLGYPAGNALPDPGYNGYVHGAYATADVFPCKVTGKADAKTCLADIRDIQPNRKRYNGAL